MVRVLVGLSVLGSIHSQRWYQLKSTHQPKVLNMDQLQHIASLSNMQAFDVTLNPILVPRVADTPSHAKVKQFIIDQMQSLGWTIETDKFQDRTPLGQKTFENIIATLDPNADRRLVLACHYDSKFTKEGTFIGATDSAVPCAMMISVARELAPKLETIKGTGSQLTLQFIFFDGEEAFRSWTDKDSLYGSRNLAKKWNSLQYPANNRDGTNFLHRMDLLVLLDLLGTPNPTFFSSISSGDRWFQHGASIEQRLRAANLLSTRNQIFRTEFAPGGIEDDHVPFMRRGVPILHLIATPFPSVWHTDADNRSALDFTTIDDLNKILRVFLVEYLQISV